MKAMILAAGLGTRMRPLTEHTPKPLLEVGGKPLIVWHIEKLAQAGIQEIIINIAWLGWKIPEALGDGHRWGVQLHYSDEQEEQALETAGGIIKALPLLGEQPFIVVNGDIWCDFDYRQLCAPETLSTTDMAHLILVNNPLHNLKGDFALEAGQLNNSGDIQYTFSGIGLYRPALFHNYTYGKRALAPILREAIKKQKLSGTLFNGNWQDIGTPARLDKLNVQLIGHS